MSSLVFQFLPLILSLTGYQAILNAKCRWDSTFTPIFVISSIVTFLYIAALINLLQPSAWLILSGGWCAWIGWGFCGFKANNKKLYFKNSFGIGFILFVIFAFALWIYTRGLLISFIDDFHHWFLVSKDIYTTNHLPTSLSPIYFYSYPPGMALFQYLNYQLIGFSEANALFASNLTLASALILFLYKYKNSGVSLLLNLAIPLVAFGSFLSWGMNLPPEPLLSVLIPCTILYYFFAENKTLAVVQLVPLLIVLVLSKPPGIFYALAISLLFIKHKKVWVCSIAVLAAVFLSWQLHNILNHLHNQMYFLEQWQHVKQSIPSDYRFYIIKAFFRYLIETSPSLNLHTNGYYLWYHGKFFNPCSVLSLLCIFAMMSIFLFVRGFKNSLTKNLILFTWIGVVLYLLSLLLTYLFVFNPQEAMSLSSFCRYNIITIGLPYFIILKIWLNQSISPSLKALKFLAVWIVLLALTICIPQQFWMAYYSSRDMQPLNQRRAVANLSNEVKSIIGDSNNIYVLNFTDFYKISYRFHIDLYPNRIQPNCFTVSFKAETIQGNPILCYFEPDDLFNEIAKYNYLLLTNVSPAFWEKYSRYFTQKYNTDNNSYLFKIDRKDKKFVLIKTLPALSKTVVNDNDGWIINHRIQPLNFFLGG